MTTTIQPAATIVVSPRSGLPAVPIPEALAVLAARTAVALEAALTGFLAVDNQNLGHFETQAAHDVQELLRTPPPLPARLRGPPHPPPPRFWQRLPKMVPPRRHGPGLGRHRRLLARRSG